MTECLGVDFSRCIGCRACELACEREHAGAGGIRVHLVEQRAAVPLACRHCLAAPCVAACPEQALVQAAPGRVVLVLERCTGCTYCVFACPFGAIEPGHATGAAATTAIAKCDLCPERTGRGDPPACVITCPTEAIRFADPDGWVRSRRRHQADRLFAARIEPV